MTTDNLDSLILTTDTGASAEIFLQGAQVTSWRPAHDDTEHLFVSEQSRYQPGVAIRGGVPIIFPQFAGRGSLPKHGFARTLAWQLSSQTRLDAHTTQAVLALHSSDATQALWPHDFAARYTVTLRDAQLDMQLEVTNTGREAFVFTAALHTYFMVGNILETQLYGLQDAQYEAGGGLLLAETRETPSFNGAIDRLYHKAPPSLTLKSPAQETQIQAQGFEDTVVWNPWAAGCEAMGDMADTDYAKMLCVEAASVINPIRLHNGESWTGRQTLLKGTAE